jgi:muramoyltetrapeptide carboxypeptidase LdcA involved in peptidoglycan recycling
VLSPSWGGPAVFPAPYELGLRRLRDVLGLEVVEHPTARAAAASPQERAADLHAAFADPRTTAVIATIGGEDQLKVLRHLDRDLLAAHPKPFFGYSDNTNLHLLLWTLGIVSYHGGSVMVQLGRPGRLHPATEASWRQALFTRGERRLVEPGESGDVEPWDWNDPVPPTAEPVLAPTEPWSWHGGGSPVQGRLWGGCLEIVDLHLRTGRYLPEPSSLDGAVLLLETSEELPSADYVYRVLMSMGERGLLERFAGALVARPKAWSLEVRHDDAGRLRYVEQQREAVLRALTEYAPRATVVLGVDAGHTDPQLVLPHGGLVRLDPADRTVHVTY